MRVLGTDKARDLNAANATAFMNILFLGVEEGIRYVEIPLPLSTLAGRLTEEGMEEDKWTAERLGALLRFGVEALVATGTICTLLRQVCTVIPV